METTRKSINEQIQEIHQLWEQEYMSAPDDQMRLRTIFHLEKVIIQHVMKLEAKAYYIQKKLDETLGIRPQTPRLTP